MADCSLGLARHRVPVILQQERGECGLACLAMLAGYFGKEIDFHSLRTEFGLSARGSTFQELLGVARRLQLIARPVRLSISEISQLQVPAVLHWRMNHFVVLVRAGRRRFLIHDPASGKRKVQYAEFDQSFTGVALEVVAAGDFDRRRGYRRQSIWPLVGSFRRFNKYMSLMLCLLLASQVLSLVPSIATQIVIDEVILGQDRTWLYRALAGLAIVMVTATMLESLRGWVSLYAGTKLSADSTVRLIDHLFALPAKFIQRRHLGDLMSKLESLSPIRLALTEDGVNAITQLVMVVTTLLIMFLYSPRLTAVSIAGFSVTLTLIFVLLARSRLLSEQILVHRAAQNSSLVESLKAFETMQGLGIADIRRLHWQRSFLLATKAQVAQGKLAIFRTAAGSAIAAAEQVAFLAFGVTGVLDKEITLGVLFAFVVLRNRFGGAAMSLTDLLLRFTLLKVHVERLFDIVRTPSTGNGPAGAVRAALVGSISAENLQFCHDSKVPVIENFHCDIAAGANVVITGPSGCGKTTLLKILCGLLEPDSGQILVDGIERSLWSRQVLCDQCAIVLQNEQLFQGTIAENISAFSPFPDLARVRSAAIIAEIWADIRNWPMQAETLIGDNGIGLSGGQVQRLALARALYRQPRILFLDEASSHLDVDTERRVLGNIARLNMTIISVAHRPDAIALAGQVIAL